ALELEPVAGTVSVHHAEAGEAEVGRQPLERRRLAIGEQVLVEEDFPSRTFHHLEDADRILGIAMEMKQLYRVRARPARPQGRLVAKPDLVDSVIVDGLEEIAVARRMVDVRRSCETACGLLHLAEVERLRRTEAGQIGSVSRRRIEQCGEERKPQACRE